MRATYEHIHFVKVADKPKTSVWTCRNNRTGGELGRVRYYGPWREYCYFPVAQGVYSRGCLADIAAFLKEVSNAHTSR